jgi:hypothetical protein
MLLPSMTAATKEPGLRPGFLYPVRDFENYLWVCWPACCHLVGRPGPESESAGGLVLLATLLAALAGMPHQSAANGGSLPAFLFREFKLICSFESLFDQRKLQELRECRQVIKSKLSDRRAEEKWSCLYFYGCLSGPR